jgi:ATP-dependent helicase/nuclease subunit A
MAEDGPGAYAATIEADIKALDEVEELNDYDSLSKFFAALSFGRLAAIRKFEGDPQKKEAVQSGRNGIKKEIDDIKKKYFLMEPEELLDQIKRVRPIVEELVRLALLFSEAMDASKRKKKILDFSDIEHFALNILVDEETKQPRRVAEEFKEHFAEIMIDEYQDSNQVQEEIMRAISQNLFMVGDVKQSIYRFRLARPELFMEKYARFTTEDSKEQRIDLHNNFRSRDEVLDFCNDIFYKIMSPDLGQVTYDEDAALYGKASYPENSGLDAELLLLDKSDELLSEEAGDDTGAQIEARLVADRIKRLMRETQVTDKASGELRKLRFSDIVILLRSLKGWGSEFAEILGGQGIPAYVESQTGYFSAIEVQTVLSMLKILDNPYQDIPMAAVLKSPIVGLDDEELAEIRISDPTVPFSAAALKCMREAEEGALYDFNRLYVSLRAQRDLPIHELLQKLLNVTGYGNYVAAMPAGEKRAANLAMLIEKAVDYEKTSYRGLFHFVRYIDKLQKYEVDFGEADTIAENADVVRIMTIHKSKGLEFPVVFVSGLSKQFNRMDSNDRLVLHPDLGLGISEISGRPRIKKNSLFRSQIADRLHRENLGEELRILYVALTRAKEKLILSGIIKDEQKTISAHTGNTLPGKPISYRERVGASGYIDWIIPAMLSYPDKYTISVTDPKTLVWESIKESDKNLNKKAELISLVENADRELVDKYGELFSYEYPYKSEADKKSKYSVSELKHESMVLNYDRTEGEAEVPEFLLEDRESYIPDFAAVGAEEKETKSPGAKRGTAVHRVMECLDFKALAGLDNKDDNAVKNFAKSELSRMEKSGELNPELKELVPVFMLENFIKSEVASRMAAAAVRGNLYREKPFVMEHEDVLVQGIIDVFWIEGDSIILLDYKTDRVDSAEELILRYKLQLELYADALSKIFSNNEKKMTAKERLIYSFRLKEVISL